VYGSTDTSAASARPNGSNGIVIIVSGNTIRPRPSNRMIGDIFIGMYMYIYHKINVFFIV
jgi:hypothetical protein